MEKKLLDLTNDDGTLKIGGLIKELIKMKKDIIKVIKRKYQKREKGIIKLIKKNIGKLIKKEYKNGINILYHPFL